MPLNFKGSNCNVSWNYTIISEADPSRLVGTCSIRGLLAMDQVQVAA